jgi:hypothetical protein
MNKKRITINKKMPTRDYINLLYFMETGKRDLDLSEYDRSALAVVKKITLRVTLEGKARMDEFFSFYPLGVSLESVLDSFPLKNKEVQGE